MTKFAERLKSTRNKLSLGQSEVARRAKLSVSCISCYETGKRKPSARHLQSLAFALDTSVAYLVGETDDPSKQEHQEIIDADTVSPYPELPAYVQFSTESFLQAEIINEVRDIDDANALRKILKYTRNQKRLSAIEKGGCNYFL
jgi:transcriptional regulator with XRE-family HTH domain